MHGSEICLLGTGCDQKMAKTPLVVVTCRVFGLYHPAAVRGDLNIRGLEGVSGGD